MKDRLYHDLVSNISKGCVLYVGAGLSHATNRLPLWSQLIMEIANNFGAHQIEDIQTYRLEYLDWCKGRDAAKLNSVLADQLSSYNKNLHPIYTHLSKIKWKAIITTNLDTLIEEAYLKLNTKTVVVDSEKSVSKTGLQDGILIVKMHGSLEKGDRILTASEYLRFDVEQVAMSSLVLTLMAQYPVCFIGAGLTDPNFTKIYGLLKYRLQDFARPGYYITETLPDFVEEFWKSRNLNFLSVSHNNLTTWLERLASDVEYTRGIPPGTIGLRAAHGFTKRHTLERLASESLVISPFTAKQSYVDMQNLYVSTVQMLDYGTFSENWESSLYQPCRKEVFKLVEKQKSLEFAYFGCGPHVPLFNDLKSEVNINDTIKNVTLCDISSEVLKTARRYFQRHRSNIRFEVSTQEYDISAGEGERWTCMLGDLIKSSTFEEFHQKIEALGPKYLLISEQSETLDRQFDILYSEMVVSFTGTAPLMAFETAAHQKFGRIVDSSELTQALARIQELWRSYNDAIYGLHLKSLSKMLKMGGYAIIVFDTDKIFTSQAHLSISSFSKGGLETLRPDTLEHRSTKDLIWEDHPYRTNGTEADDIEDYYFLAHTHSVSIEIFQRRFQ